MFEGDESVESGGGVDDRTPILEEGCAEEKVGREGCRVGTVELIKPPSDISHEVGTEEEGFAAVAGVGEVGGVELEEDFEGGYEEGSVGTIGTVEWRRGWEGHHGHQRERAFWEALGQAKPGQSSVTAILSRVYGQGCAGSTNAWVLLSKLYIIAVRRRRLNVHARIWEGRRAGILGILVFCRLVAICGFESDRRLIPHG